MNIKMIAPILTLFFPLAFFLAQKPENADQAAGIFSSRAEYEQFMGAAKSTAYGEGGTAEMRAMIPMLNDLALARPMGWTNQTYGGEGGQLDLLSNPEVRQDLEMVDQQYEELQAMNAAIQKRTTEQLRALDFNDRDNFVQQIHKIRDQANEDLNALLLPHQVQRLRQIQTQSQLRRRSLVDIITSDPVKSNLKVTDQQSETLREEEKKIEEELSREIARLQAMARERLLSKLTPVQKAEVENMIGDMFEFTISKSQPNSKPKTRKDHP